MTDPFTAFLATLEVDCRQVGEAIAEVHGPELIVAGVPPKLARKAARRMIMQSTDGMDTMLQGRGWTDHRQRRRLHQTAKSAIVTGFATRYGEMLSAHGGRRS